MARHRTPEEYISAVVQVCQSRGFIYMGTVGTWKGAATKLRLSCNKDGYVWESGNINHLLRGRGCPKCAFRATGERSAKNDEDTVAEFFASGAFLDGTKFTKVPAKFRTWEMHCPVCSNDEYVINGVCSGKFRANASTFKRGGKPCRCTHGYDWTREQREYKVKQVVEKAGYKFIGWDNGVFRGANSRCILECTEHGCWTSKTTNIIYKGSGCPECSEHGFSTKKAGFLYVIKAYNKSTSFTGYGISNVFVDRLITHAGKIKSAGFLVECLTVFELDGAVAKEIEDSLRAEFECNPQNIAGFKREATLGSLYDDVVLYVKRLKGEIYERIPEDCC